MNNLFIYLFIPGIPNIPNSGFRIPNSVIPAFPTYLKEGYKLLDHDVTALTEKANNKEIDTLNRKIDDLENRSKRNNVVIWGLKEGAEKDCGSVGEFLQDELFSKHMGLENIEVMRAHRTKINQACCER